MPKMTERERLSKLEAEQAHLAEEAQTIRRSLRAHYGQLIADLAVERIGEREFRDILGHVIRVGGTASLAALKSMPPEETAAAAPKVRRSTG